jgi:hypothetical protein
MVSRNFLVNTIPVGADHAQHDPIAWSRSLGAKPPDLSKRSMNEAPEETSLASKLMFVFMSFETGHPVFAFIAMDWNVASSIPGIFATMERCTEVMRSRRRPYR